MAHAGGLWPPGCLALVALFSLVHSQHGKGVLEAGTGWRAGRWARGLGSPCSTENPEPASREASARHPAERGSHARAWADGDSFSLATWGAGWG